MPNSEQGEEEDLPRKGKQNVLFWKQKGEKLEE